MMDTDLHLFLFSFRQYLLPPRHKQITSESALFMRFQFRSHPRDPRFFPLDCPVWRVKGQVDHETGQVKFAEGKGLILGLFPFHIGC